MRLSVVIPALNEEDSISSIINRTLSSESYLTSNSPITSLEVIVVSDGSTDKTVEIASTFLPRIKLIVFEKNKGYGAAIKQGWSDATGELLAFIDADGTCDPLFFSNLANLLVKKNADVVLGCRLNKESKMPLIRRFGNFLFAKLLTFLSSKYVKDTASGMRIIRKTSIKKLYPLPDGLHFTPAMSARALLNTEIIIAEENMPYHEREGESKLSVIKDGMRFMKVIMNTAFLYRPQILLNTLAIIFYSMGILIILPAIIHYIKFENILNWMIYRFVFFEVVSVFAIVLFSTSYILQNTIWLSLTTNLESNQNGINARFFNSKWSTIFAILLIFIGFSLIYESLTDRMRIGQTTEHWSRYIIFSYFEITALIILTTKWSKWMLGLLKQRIQFMQSEEYKKL